MKIASIRKRRADAYQSPMRKHQSLGLTSVETTRHGHVIKVPKLHADIPILGFIRAQKGVAWVIWTVHQEIHRLELRETKISVSCYRRHRQHSVSGALEEYRLMNLCVKVGTGARTDVEQIKEFLPWSDDRFTKGSWMKAAEFTKGADEMFWVWMNGSGVVWSTTG